MRHFHFLLGACCLLCACSTPQNPPRGNERQEALLGGDYPDPTVMRDGDDYYMTHSAFDYQPGLTVWHSTDLKNWEPISYGLKTYLGSIWAPDICRYGDKYYIYFTVATRGRTNCVVWADSPYGPWSDPIDLHVGNIDPCHVVGEDGTRWLYMSGGNRVKLAPDGLSVVPGTMEHIYDGWPIPEDWITEGMCLEGPKLRKIGEYYYYLNAEGGTAGPPTSHMVVVARSKSLDGPWENSPINPLIHTYYDSDRWWSKGHGSLIDGPDGKWYCIYHSYENSYTDLGRQTLIEEVRLNKDGWFEPVSSRRYELGHHLVDNALLSQFRVGLEWKFYRRFEPERLEFQDGALTMQGRGHDASDSYPLLFVQGEKAYEFEAEIELHGNVRAGLLCYYDSTFFQGTGFDRFSRYRYRKGTASRCGRSGAEHLWLRLRNDRHITTGYYSLDGVNWQRETWGMDVSGYTHNTLYQFQSVLPAIFVSGDGYATFRNFQYRILE